jgi:hypothetical protein
VISTDLEIVITRDYFNWEAKAGEEVLRGIEALLAAWVAGVAAKVAELHHSTPLSTATNLW